MLYQMYWRNKETRQTHTGFVKAKDRDTACDIMQARLMDGFVVTHCYKADESWITPQSVTINFANPAEYTLF